MPKLLKKNRNIQSLISPDIDNITQHHLLYSRNTMPCLNALAQSSFCI